MARLSRDVVEATSESGQCRLQLSRLGVDVEGCLQVLSCPLLSVPFLSCFSPPFALPCLPDLHLARMPCASKAPHSLLLSRLLLHSRKHFPLLGNR